MNGAARRTLKPQNAEARSIARRASRRSYTDVYLDTPAGVVMRFVSEAGGRRDDGNGRRGIEVLHRDGAHALEPPVRDHRRARRDRRDGGDDAVTDLAAGVDP
jgi:hypothetical protein